MKLSLVSVFVLSLLWSFTFSTTALAEDDLPPSVKTWKLLGSGTTVQPDVDYCFQNQTNLKCIRYGSRGKFGGINLVWDNSDTLTNVRFVNASGGEVKYGEPLALRVDRSRNQFVQHDKRSFGINLSWSSEPVFEWIIVGGAEGQAVKIGEEFAIINTVEKDFLIYARRGKKVINLRWYADRNKRGFTDRVKQVVKKEAIQYSLKYLGL